MSTEERVELAKDYFKQGYNCCQSVVLAFKDVCGVEEDVLLKMTVGLGGGVGRMREVCGCVCGMAVLSGFIADSGATPHEQKANSYALTQKMADQFREVTGSIVCRELLGAGGLLNQVRHSAPVPEQRTPEYYKKRPCAEMVVLSVRIVSGYLD